MLNQLSTTTLLLSLLYPYSLLTLAQGAPQFDVLFLVDSSPSMCPYTSAIATGMSDFVDQISTDDIDVHYAVASFGGTPVVLQPFLVFIAIFLTIG
jgi:hypothetical protein